MPDETLVQTEATVATLEPTAEVKPDMTLPEAEPAKIEAIPLALSETIVWNQTQNNMSVGLAVLNQDQLHIAIYRTVDIPKTLDPEKAKGLTMVKPNEAMLFRMKK